MKRLSSVIMFIAVLLLPAAAPFIASSQEFELKSEKATDIPKENTRITIRCNTSDASVYLNGEYQGRTTLTINDLKPGRYALRIEKKGYETKEFFIRVNQALSETWYIELKKNTGFVSFSIEPSGCIVSIDGNSADSVFNEVEEGPHTVLIKKFGYTEENRSIFVFRDTAQTVEAKLEPAVFSTSDLIVNKKSFSTLNSGSLGTCTFSFSVTAHGSGSLTIKNNDGETVCSYTFADFTTWNQIASWDGKDSAGIRVPDGTYTAFLNVHGTDKNTAQDEISANKIKGLTVSVDVDSSVRYPVASVTPAGLGIGILPASFMSPSGSMFFSASAGATFSSSEGPFYAAPFSFAFSSTPAPWFEYSINASFYAGIDDTPVTAGGSMKFSLTSKSGKKIAAGETAYECAAVAKIGFSSQTIFEPYGADIGNGLGAGLVFGAETLHIYAGLSSIFTFGSTTGNLKGTDCVWQNGLCVQYRSGSTALGAYGTLNSCFGKSTEEEDVRDGESWARAVQTGIDFSAMIPDTSVSVSVKPGILLYSTRRIYSSCQISFSVLY